MVCGDDERSQEIPPHERPFAGIMHGKLGYEYVAYKSMDEARADQDAIVILTGDYGGQVYLTCPLVKVQCSQPILEKLLAELGRFAWGDGEDIYFERVRPDRFVFGGMGGAPVMDDVWIHGEFRNLHEIHVDLLPDVAAVLAGHSDSILPGVVTKLVAHLERVDASTADSYLDDFGNISNIAGSLADIGSRAAAALPVLRRLAVSRKFRKYDHTRDDIAVSIRKIESGA